MIFQYYRYHQRNHNLIHLHNYLLWHPSRILLHICCFMKNCYFRFHFDFCLRNFRELILLLFQRSNASLLFSLKVSRLLVISLLHLFFFYLFKWCIFLSYLVKVFQFYHYHQLIDKFCYFCLYNIFFIKIFQFLLHLM